MWELRPLSAAADFTMFELGELQSEFSNPHHTHKNGAPNPYENIKHELGLPNYKCKIPKISLTKMPLQINLAGGLCALHPREFSA